MELSQLLNELTLALNALPSACDVCVGRFQMGKFLFPIYGWGVGRWFQTRARLCEHFPRLQEQLLIGRNKISSAGAAFSVDFANASASATTRSFSSIIVPLLAPAVKTLTIRLAARSSRIVSDPRRGCGRSEAAATAHSGLWHKADISNRSRDVRFQG